MTNGLCTNQNLSLKMNPIKFSEVFEIQTDPQMPRRRPDPVLIIKKKRTCQLVDFAVQTDHGGKRKKTKKLNKYQDLARELKDV